ncbi:sulfate adenylyltransferase [Pseudonocardia sp. C8]|uniref:sulfate adenylyltransferase subunit 1 n=1 Tax=Pseudonocardia sp. C8 TaxID=2762759 RepID=UPI0016428DF6|nr:GTP-binding protein [Pseudonocardia sp. C8]MBC3193219.1 sulfate adenylyltransferase [Pseudonocardia sp. C8]
MVDSAQPRDLLRFATAGSVDDGKSTLVGRLLYDTKSVLADQIEAVERASVDKGMTTPDLSLLVDGLRAEREQGITIDVAYRYFGTPSREFVLADTPGHVQYTRNTVTGASTAELAVLLVDARNGVVAQTRRHAAVLSLLRVPRLVLAINKIDLIDYDEAKIAGIGKEFVELTRSLGFADDAVQVIPVSALVGDNVATRSDETPWYEGPTLLEHLESVPVEGPDAEAPFRLPVQYVIRPRAAAGAAGDDLHDYRGYAGQVASGTVRPGDEVVVLPEGHRTTVSEVRTADGPLDGAGAGLSVTVLLADDIDAPRGAMIAAAADPPEVTSELDATLCWLHEKPLAPGARLLLKHGTRTTQVIVGALTSRLDTETVSYIDAPDELAINDIGRVSLRVADPLPVDPYARIRTTGGFVLIDPPTGNTLAAGLVGDPLASVPAAI